MDFYFVYSSGGGAGDWNGVNRMFKEYMPQYLKDHLLIKFGDIFFNHRSNKSIIKPTLWNRINNAREWLVNKTNDEELYETPNLIMDVGTTKIVSFLTANNYVNSVEKLVNGFDDILVKEKVLEKYCNIINNSNINFAVTFDIPNLFKVRAQVGNVTRTVYGRNEKQLIEASSKYANRIFEGVHDESKLLTTISGLWSVDGILYFMSKLKYKPTKLGIGGLSDLRNLSLFAERLNSMDEILNFSNYDRVHFLGCGGLEKVDVIKNTLGNRANFSVDNTTPYNRSIDGSTNGNTQSGYYDYKSCKMFRIKPDNLNKILALHKESEDVACFSMDEMEYIIKMVIRHQSNNSSDQTYEARGKLVMHNFDVFRYHAQTNNN